MKCLTLFKFYQARSDTQGVQTGKCLVTKKCLTVFESTKHFAFGKDLKYIIIWLWLVPDITRALIG